MKKIWPRSTSYCSKPAPLTCMVIDAAQRDELKGQDSSMILPHS
jgi:hypothetical protein